MLLPAYLDSYGFHGVHGRALALASGLKAARKDLTVLVAGGDGDGLSIGGNHFIHACRRNMNLTYIVMDNEVYGMTKGQASPTTHPEWDRSKLTPRGTGIRPFNPAQMALTAGATFIARGFTGDPNGLAKTLVEAIEHPGFSFVRILQRCPVFTGDIYQDAVRNPELIEMLEHLEELRKRILKALLALGIGWGTPVEGRGSSGTFRETWEVRWEPELSVRLVERAGYGTTLETAATARAASTSCCACFAKKACLTSMLCAALWRAESSNAAFSLSASLLLPERNG